MSAYIAKELSADVLRFNPPCFSEAALHDFLKDQYGIVGKLKPLAGERDQNMRVTADDGKQYVLKIAGPDELDETVDFQIKALLHLQIKDPGLIAPIQIKTQSGEQAVKIYDNDGRSHWVRVVSYVEGEPMDLYDSLNFDAIRELGRITGQLCAALKAL